MFKVTGLLEKVKAASDLDPLGIALRKLLNSESAAVPDDVLEELCRRAREDKEGAGSRVSKHVEENLRVDFSKWRRIHGALALIEKALRNNPDVDVLGDWGMDVAGLRCRLRELMQFQHGEDERICKLLRNKATAVDKELERRGVPGPVTSPKAVSSTATRVQAKTDTVAMEQQNGQSGPAPSILGKFDGSLPSESPRGAQSSRSETERSDREDASECEGLIADHHDDSDFLSPTKPEDQELELKKLLQKFELGSRKTEAKRTSRDDGNRGRTSSSGVVATVTKALDEEGIPTRSSCLCSCLRCWRGS